MVPSGLHKEPSRSKADTYSRESGGSFPKAEGGGDERVLELR